MSSHHLRAGFIVLASVLVAGCTSAPPPSFAPHPYVPPVPLEEAPAAAVASPGLAGPGPGESVQEWARAWMAGPVSTISTTEEQRLYADLSPTERVRFIELFWQRRDPDLDTAQNEYLSDFAVRLEMTARYFSRSGSPGWNTAFGTTLLIVGIPARIELVPPQQPLPSSAGDDGVRPEDGSAYEGLAVRFYYPGSTIVYAGVWQPLGPGTPVERKEPYLVFTYWGGSWRAGCPPASPPAPVTQLGSRPTNDLEGGNYSRGGRGWQAVNRCSTVSTGQMKTFERAILQSLVNPAGYSALTGY